MKNKIVVCMCLLLAIFTANSQNNIVKNSQQEVAYVHLNSTLFFTGEYLFYKGYVLDNQKKNFSKISDILYVEMVGEDAKIIFRHKLALENGQGYSDFFIPNSVPSGNYKIIAYTPSMVAAKRQFFFETDIGIINPYNADQSAVLATSESGTTAKQFNTRSETITSEFQSLEFELNKKTYSTREVVPLKILNNSNEMGFGNYSLSVTKTNNVQGLPKVTSHNYESSNTSVFNNTHQIKNSNNDGIIVSGYVVHSETNTRAKDVDIALSIAGEDFVFNVTTTDTAGEFTFVLDTAIESEKALLQLLVPDAKNFKIEMNQEQGISYDNLTFGAITIDASLQQDILDRSINNQIENAYYSVKPDTIKASAPPKSFIHFEKQSTYNVDDYTSFPTLEEVFTEYVQFVWTTKDSAGNKVVRVFQREFSEDSGNLPLLFIDGVFIANHSDFLAVEMKTVETISIVQREYQFGATEYQGVVLLTTKDGRYGESISGSPFTEINLFAPQKKKSYYHQTYSSEVQEDYTRIPDFRTQLLWKPSVSVNKLQKTISFYTSDIPGTYEIVLEGFTERGQPISIKETIQVND